MKIVHIIPSLELAGAERMCQNLAIEQIKNHNAVYVISLYSEKTEISDNLEKNGVVVFMLNKHRGFDFSIIRSINNILNMIKPDIIHSHLYVIKYLLLFILVHKTKIIHTIHNEADKELPKFDQILHYFMYKTNKIIPVAISNEIAQSVQKKYHIILSREQIILNGVQVERFVQKTNYDFNGNIKILNLARITEQKNSMLLAKVFYRIHNKYPNCELWYVGAADELYMNKVKEYIRNNELEDFVKFMGIQKDVRKILKESDIFVLASKYEGVPLAIIEAMATGLPIVATSVGGVKDILDNEENSILCKCDENEIVEAIIRVIEDDNFRKKIGKNAINKSNLYSSKIMEKQYFTLYEKS